MNQILHWLSEGDLRSDGLSNEVVKIILQEPDLIDDLMEGLDSPEEVIRGHTADALEKIARSRPDLLEPYIPRLLTCLRTDPVAMVKMHLAMILGHLADREEQVDDFIAVLLSVLHDKSVFAISWAVVSLCIIGRRYPDKREEILREIVLLQKHKSPALRTKVRQAVGLLTDEAAPFPPGWIKRMRMDEKSGKQS